MRTFGRYAATLAGLMPRAEKQRVDILVGLSGNNGKGAHGHGRGLWRQRSVTQIAES